MDWKRAMKEERVALGRVAALLCALAGLAELAAGRSAIVRCLVLLFLRRAEATARDFVAGGPASMAAPVLPAGGAPADARRLAASLRVLARDIGEQARLMGRRCRDNAGRAASPCPGPMAAIRDLSDRLSAVLASGLGWPSRVLAPDTS